MANLDKSESRIRNGGTTTKSRVRRGRDAPRRSIDPGKVVCSYCGCDAKLLTGKELFGSGYEGRVENFWVCGPCAAWVGCHVRSDEYGVTGEEPLGTLAKDELRKSRQVLHGRFDLLWGEFRWSRSGAYIWLANRMGIPFEECHIGMFDLERCERATMVLEGLAAFAESSKIEFKKEEDL